MTKKDKLLQRLMSRPTSLSYLDIERALIIMGFVKIEVKGSHKKFKHPLLNKDIVIPIHNNDCKDFYKKMVAKILKKEFNR